MSRPRINMNAVADNDAQPGEKIIEVSSEAGGCLISFAVIDERLVVNVYRLDEDTVEIRAPKENTFTA